jgi:guanylate kinase
MFYLDLKNMNEHKRIILCGPGAAGKDFIRNKFRDKGYQIDISYTSRPPRDNEIDGKDYHFIGDKFPFRISQNEFYEYVQHGEYWYGTGMKEWNESDVFIMETEGLKLISPEDRPHCLIIYIDTPLDVRIKRMKERGWDMEKISKRIKIDIEKFKDFFNYDLKISS